MATPQQAIDSVLFVHDDVDSADADNTKRRARLLNFLQQVHDFIWNFAAWEWTYREGTLQIFNGSSTGNLDDLFDFLEFSRSGSLYDTAQRRRMVETSRYKFSRAVNEGNRTFGTQDSFFAIWDGKVHIPYTVAADTDFLAFYRIRAPTLADDSTDFQIPDRYYSGVILPGLVYKSQESKNDARETWAAQFQQGLSQMLSIENPMKTQNRKMPLAVRGAW